MKTLIIGILFSALFPMGVYPQISQDTIPVKNKNKEVVNYISFEKGFKNGFWYGTKDKVFYDTSVTNEAKKFCLDSPMSFYGDRNLDATKQHNNKTAGNFTFDYRGSGDSNKNGVRNWNDYNQMFTGPFNERMDINLNGINADATDKQIFKDYLLDTYSRRFLPNDWDYYQNSTDRQANFMASIALDNTQIYKPGWTCVDYSTQLELNEDRIENLAGCNLNFNMYDTTSFYFNKPVYIVNDKTNTNVDHWINAILVGDSITNFYHWRFLEPQNDQIVLPGSASMSANSYVDIKKFAYFWSNFLNQYVYGDLPLVDFDLQNGQVISTVVQMPEAVLYRTLKNVHLHGNKPLNVTVNWVNGQADTSANNTGWPTNVLPVGTQSTRSDSTNQQSGIWNPAHYNYNVWRDWVLVDTSSHGIIDSTLGSRRQVFWNNGRAPQIINVQDTAKPVAIWTPNGQTYLYTQYIQNGIPATQATDNCGVWACVRTTTSGQGSNPNNCNYWEFPITVKDSLYDPSSNNRVMTSLVNIVLDPIQWTYVPPTWDINWWENWQNPANTGGMASATNPAGPSVNVTYVDDLTAQNPDTTQCEHYNFPDWRKFWAFNNLSGSCQDSTYALQLINVHEELAPSLDEVPNDTIVPIGGCITPACLGFAQGTDSISGVPPTPASYDSVIFQGDSSIIFDRHHYVIDICEDFSPQGIQNVIQEIMPGVQGFGKGKTFYLYPNPTNNLVNFVYNSKESEKAKIEIFDLTGRKLERITVETSPGENKSSIDVTKYPPGTYLIRFFSTEKPVTVKLFIK